MTKHTIATVALGFVAGVVLAITPARAENRPAELDMFQRLNGVQGRDLNPSTLAAADGGGLTLWSLDAGPGCNAVRTGAVYEMHCGTAGHFCPWFDGGVSCGSTPGAVTYGRPVAASTPADPKPFFFIAPGDPTSGTTTNVCIAPKSGDTTMLCALYRMR